MANTPNNILPFIKMGAAQGTKTGHLLFVSIPGISLCYKCKDGVVLGGGGVKCDV